MGPDGIFVMTVDLEDWFHCLEPDPGKWGQFERRADIGTKLLLDLLEETGSRATFFVLGDVALHQPEVVASIAERGHEIGSHGMNHQFVTRLSPEVFRDDLRDSLRIVREVCGCDCRCYRAPYFSITRRERWALEILRDTGIQVDSSIFPVRNPRYGDPGAPRLPSMIIPGLWEWPISTYASPLGNVPIGGGVYFRLLPVKVTLAAMRHAHKRHEGFLLYLHPWEVDADHPRTKVESRFLAFRHYYGLHQTLSKLRRVLVEHKAVTLSQGISCLERNGVTVG